jgi:hypothetical protein
MDIAFGPAYEAAVDVDLERCTLALVPVIGRVMSVIIFRARMYRAHIPTR